MGIVIKQSFINTVMLFLGFAIGGINVLFLYTSFLQDDYFGLVTFLMSTSVILLPLVTLGVQHTILKFYSSYTSNNEKNTFLIGSLLLPLLTIIPIAFIGVFSYETISEWLSKKNKMIENYVWLIFLLAIFMGYFEVFYAWSKVKLKTVFGNFIKEVFARLCIFVLLFLVYFKQINNEQFVYSVVAVYAIRAFVMKIYAFYLCKPTFSLVSIGNKKEIFQFSLFMIISGSAAGILLEIDKFMIPQLKEIAQVAYYTVAVYIASVVAIPNRAMQQITAPLTAQEMNKGNLQKVKEIYQKSSLNLLVVGGLLFLLINSNVKELYQLVDKPQFLQGIPIVFIISVAKIIELSMGTANSILLNSKKYKIYFYLSVLMAASAFLCNYWLIPLLGITGAAIATLAIVFLYGLVKVAFIYHFWGIAPFSLKTTQTIVIIFGFYFIFYFIDFKWNPVLLILLKSVLITILYLTTIHKLKISDTINDLISNFKVKLKER